ncbi:MULTISPECIES: hypothetical protein [unclassified Pseudomonas]|uniref:hypothetical protein n=1 Tax=unclassified Pseudomonas TaxID=196821 RepID=UPI001CBA7650|nr:MULTISPECIES: hypothetical protein [unclassified Pseudomonas]
MKEESNGAPSKSPYQAYVAGFGSAIALTLGVLGFIQNFSDIRFVDVQSYRSMREIEEKYYPKSFVDSHYLDKVLVVNDYIKKDELKEKLSGFLSVEKVSSDYVPRAAYDRLFLNNEELAARLNDIPSPFRGITKTLSRTGEWSDEQLGVSISVKNYIPFSDGVDRAVILLSLPDSPLHQENLYSNDIERCKWTFRKNNREFELKVEKFNPLVFKVVEVSLI